MDENEIDNVVSLIERALADVDAMVDETGADDMTFTANHNDVFVEYKFYEKRDEMQQEVPMAKAVVGADEVSDADSIHGYENKEIPFVELEYR